LRLVGCFLLLSGWLIVLAALMMMPALQARFSFVLAGLAVEILGLGLLIHGYRAIPGSQE
jgi:hypothetical protein